MKRLNDGTIAEVGLVVVVIQGVRYGHDANDITEITDLRLDEDDTKHVDCRGCSARWFAIASFTEDLRDLRKATALEILKYHAVDVVCDEVFH